MAEDFDRSFDYFLKHDDQKKDVVVGITSSSDKAADAWNQSLLDQTLNVMSTSGMTESTSFFNNNILEFAVIKTSNTSNTNDNQQQFSTAVADIVGTTTTRTTTSNNNITSSSNLITSNNKNNNNSTENESSTICISVHEQISAMYDDFSQEGAISVTGTISVQQANEIFLVQQQEQEQQKKQQQKQKQKSSFCIVIKEVSTNIQKLELTTTTTTTTTDDDSILLVCEDISKEAHDDRNSLLYPSDRAIRILVNNPNLNPNPTVSREANNIIATYSCVTKLRPVPLVR
jgi:hypothetical protein